MDAFEYTFTSKTGDTYIVRILNDGMRFLSSEMISIIEKANYKFVSETSRANRYTCCGFTYIYRCLW